MSHGLIPPVGFGHRTDGPTISRRRSVELIATVALALSTLIAVTAVSIGIARADALGLHVEPDGAPFAIALFIGLVLAGMGGLTALMAEDRSRR